MKKSDLMPRVVRGDQAVAIGAAAAGVRVVGGYPGSPATGVFDGLLELLTAEEAHIEWAPNEKVAMELAFGASLGGARSLVVLKSVGMNVALDPLATFSLSGCHAGLVILLGDDPGGWSSQNEQDSRWTARVAEVPLLEPVDVGSAAALMVQAFAWSEAFHTPVIVRISRAMSLARARVESPARLPAGVAGFVRERNRWVVLPLNVVGRHRALHETLGRFGQALDGSAFDVVSGSGRLGVIGVGFMYRKVAEVVGAVGGEADRIALLGLSSVWPLPEQMLSGWLRERERVLVLEEGGPFAEQEIRALAQRHGLAVQILGRADRVVPSADELTVREVAAALRCLDPGYLPREREVSVPPMPSRIPLCADCPYIPAMEALIGAMNRHGGRERYIVIGETGCMVRANLPPMELFDIKYGLGSGLGLAMGLAIANPGQHIVALVGDSSFFHSDINTMPYLGFKELPMTVVVLDNRTTALTGGQAHPGSDRDERGGLRTAADLTDIVAACGVTPTVLRPEEREAMDAAFDEAFAVEGEPTEGVPGGGGRADGKAGPGGPRVVIVRGPCPRYR